MKTLMTVLEVAAIATLAVVLIGTGVGVVAGVGLAASFEAAVAGVGIVLGVSAATAGTLVLASASIVAGDILAPKLPKPDTSVTPLKAPLCPRVRAYGRSRLYGNYVLFVSNADGVGVDIYSFVDTGGVAIDGAEGFYLGDKLVASTPGYVVGLPDKSYSGGNVYIDMRSGYPTETAFARAIELLPGVWTDKHRGDGVVTGMVAWAAVKAKNYQDIYPSGQPPLSIVARWLRVFDWRDPTQRLDVPSSWKWTENPVLHLADYVVVVEKAQRDAPEQFPTAESLQRAWDRYIKPTLATWTAAADDADSPMPLKAGGTEPRYRGLVSHKLTDPNKDVKTRILACFDGWLCARADGALICHSGRFQEPTVALGADEIVSYSLERGVFDEDAVNDITVTYVSAAHAFNVVDATSWTDADDIARRGSIRSESLSDDVPSHSQARRLAKRKMIKGMARWKGTITTTSAGRIVRGERYIWLDIIEQGAVFYSGYAEITQLTRNLAGGGVTFSWIEATPAIDDWIPALEEGDPAPTADIVAPVPLSAPDIVTATPVFSDVGQTPDGDLAPGDPVSGARVSITATADGIETRPDVSWSARWRVGTSGAWNEREYPDSDPGPGVTIMTEFVPLADNVNVEVAYTTGDGRASDWSAAAVVDTTP